MLAKIISRVQRNHALEHATIHVLSEKERNFSAQGNSTHKGFYLNIYGDVAEEKVHTAVTEALQRMKDGEHHLAVHPNCGTVLLTTATLATLAAQAAFAVEQRRQGRQALDAETLIGALPSAILSVVISLIVSRPIGMQIQEKYTTDGDVGDLEVKTIRRIEPSAVTRIFQLLVGGSLKPTAYVVETAN